MKDLPNNLLKKADKQPKFKEQKQHDVSKQDITFYSKNPSKIWKDIAISEVKNNGKIA